MLSVCVVVDTAECNEREIAFIICLGSHWFWLQSEATQRYLISEFWWTLGWFERSSRMTQICQQDWYSGAISILPQCSPRPSSNLAPDRLEQERKSKSRNVTGFRFLGWSKLEIQIAIAELSCPNLVPERTQIGPLIKSNRSVKTSNLFLASWMTQTWEQDCYSGAILLRI